MRIPAGDERTRLLLRKRYQAVGCYYCSTRAALTSDHVHTDCPRRPCFLCKRPGHTSLHCPFRTRPNAHTAAVAAILRARHRLARLHYFARARELDPVVPNLHLSLPYVPNRHFRAELATIALRAHPKRVTALDWHPSGAFLLSGDKSGVLRVLPIHNSLRHGAIDPHNVPTYRTDPAHVHYCNINNIVFDPNRPHLCYTTSSDGTLCSLSIPLLTTPANTRSDNLLQSRDTLLDLNPDGWQGSVTLFKMLYGLAFDARRNALYAGATDGSIRRLDPREPPHSAPHICSKFHAKKVTCIHVNPLNPDLVVTASNDATVCLWDARKFVETHALGSYQHDRVVSSAYFSPNTGAKLLTTSLDNKLRVWDSVHAFQGNVNQYHDAAPLEIVHSHDFHRHLTPFRAVWDPKDWKDDLFMCGRFLGDAYYDELDQSGQAHVLHPIDMFSASAGTVVHSLIDSRVSLICTSNRFSPTADVVATAASVNLILWSPPTDDECDDTEYGRRNEHGRRQSTQRRADDDDDDNDDNDNDNGDRRRGGGGGVPKKRKLTAVVAKRERT